jgi:hypothetical protein
VIHGAVRYAGYFVDAERLRSNVETIYTELKK